LVDTLFDLPLTAQMLKTMRDAVPAARNVGKLVNTHANGDHVFGNQLVEGAETKSTGREGANTWVFGAAPGNLRRAATDWWSNEDSNQGPGRFYRRLRRDRCAIVAEAVREWRAVDTNTAYVERGNLRGDWPNHS
jgi:glyoxylase-like metal-dependent hydrolase (beta-lactamase superfamily II)